MTTAVQDDPRMMAHPGPALQLRRLRREGRVRALAAIFWLAVIIGCFSYGWQARAFNLGFVAAIATLIMSGVFLAMHLKSLIEIRGAMHEAKMDQLEDDIRRKEVEG